MGLTKSYTLKYIQAINNMGYNDIKDNNNDCNKIGTIKAAVIREHTEPSFPLYHQLNITP